MGLARSTYYDEPAGQPIEEARLVELKEICAEWPCYGYRRVTAQLHAEGKRHVSLPSRLRWSFALWRRIDAPVLRTAECDQRRGFASCNILRAGSTIVRSRDRETPSRAWTEMP